MKLSSFSKYNKDMNKYESSLPTGQAGMAHEAKMPDFGTLNIQIYNNL